MSHYNMLKEEKRDIEQKFSVSNVSAIMFSDYRVPKCIHRT